MLWGNFNSWQIQRNCGVLLGFFMQISLVNLKFWSIVGFKFPHNDPVKKNTV